METTLSIPDPQVLAQKAATWGKFGEAVYTTEISIQNKAREALSGHWLPGKPSELTDAEALLKSLKAAKAAVQTERKAITTKTDALTARLMEPEKSFDEPIKVLEAAIIKVKKEHEAVENAKRAKEDERKQIIEDIKVYVSRCDANYKTIISNNVDIKYKGALNGDIKPSSLEDYLNECRASITQASFPKAKPELKFSIHTVEEVGNLLREHVTISRADYVEMFNVELIKQFSDYEVAYNNKAEALKQQAGEKAAKDLEIQEQQQQSVIAAKLEAASETLDTEPTLFTKALKKSYEVDMPETIESVLAIQAAFAANIKLCKEKVRVTKWFAFTPAQAAAALAKVKCDDNNFQPTGITFKEVDKL